MPSGLLVYCTMADIYPSGPTSLQPLDISIDISHGARTLKGVTFHLHMMLIKIHPYGLEKRGVQVLLFPTFWKTEMRFGRQYKTSRLKRLRRTSLNNFWGDPKNDFASFFEPQKNVTTFHLRIRLYANKSWFESSSIPPEPISGRSYLHLCQATCIVLLSADVLAPAGLVWSDSRPGLTCQLLLSPSLYTGLRPVTDGQPAVHSKRLASKDIPWCLFCCVWNYFWQHISDVYFLFSTWSFFVYCKA